MTLELSTFSVHFHSNIASAAQTDPESQGTLNERTYSCLPGSCTKSFAIATFVLAYFAASTVSSLVIFTHCSIENTCNRGYGLLAGCFLANGTVTAVAYVAYIAMSRLSRLL